MFSSLLSPSTNCHKIREHTFYWGAEGVGSHYVAQAGLKLVFLLLPPPELRDYRCVSHHTSKLILFFFKVR
jgi:hypothetical protein